MKTDLGKLGTVTIEAWETPDLEVFAKLESSYNGCSGPNYSDDNCGATGGYTEPTFAIE